MKLNLLPARAGADWVRAGLAIFARQPLAMASQFLMFMALVSLAAMIPLVGGVLGLTLVPAATLGVMAAARETQEGRFPMPATLFAAFRQGPRATRAMLMLGALYALAVVAVTMLSTLADGGRFAELYVAGGGITPELIADPQVRAAMWLSMALYLPVSLAFWHAPALVHWYGVAPVKSLFFSLVAVLRNARAYLLYAALWVVVGFAGGMVLLMLSALSGSAGIARAGLLPMALLVAAMFFTSLWPTFRDTFEPGAPAGEASP